MPASDVDLLGSRTPEDFGTFYERHATAVTSYIARRTRKPELIIDLVAETFARALEHRRSFDPRRGPALSWLHGIARTLMADAERHGKVADSARVRLKMEPLALDGEQLARVSERGRTDMAAAVAQLPESQRISVLRRVHGEIDDYDPMPLHVGGSDHITEPPPKKRRWR